LRQVKSTIKTGFMLTILGSTLAVSLILSALLILMSRSDIISSSEKHM